MAIPAKESSDLRTTVFAGTSEMAARMRALDWSATALSAVHQWPLELVGATRVLLGNRFQLLLLWGNSLCCLYNDAYISVLGAKHPWALGRPVKEVWSEAWPVIGPMFESVMAGGPAKWTDDLQLIIHRNGFDEETHFVVSYSPVPLGEKAGMVGGVLCTVYETSEKVLAERRITMLRELGAIAIEEGVEEKQVAAHALEVMGRNTTDLPFALLYLAGGNSTRLSLAGAVGVRSGSQAAPLSMEVAPGMMWPLDQSARAPILLDLGERRRWFTERPWPETPRQAYIVPFRSADPKTPLGYLVTGVSPRLRWDERYSTFLEATARQIGADIAAATMLRAERERAEALAELDRAKTVFFTNISHEFRTPLTLLLGPVEELLGASSEGTRAPLEAIHRNALRLLKLVNSLLEFSRIEAGRMEMDLVATDLAAYTAELASSFRSAAEKAGLEFHVHCAPLASMVAVDRGMWEKIVLNLLSNAFKFTLLGTITVRLEAVAEEVRLSVADTGVGMAEDEVPRLFERFHRAAGKMGRSFEGTGIGLAMTRDLVKLHGGWIQASSRLGHGTTITVHLPLDARGSSANTAAGGQVGAIGTDFARSTVNEVLQMAAVSGTAAGELGDAAILVADDNADIREYLVRLLAPHYRVRAVSNGAEALAAAETAPPDLIVSDVMMPSLDGFELLRELRQRAATRPIPVILVSARAGEEALVTGLGQGADDYLTKPFTARELLARVAAQLNLQERRRDLERKERDLRRQAEAAEMRYRSILTNMTDAVAELDGDGVIRACNARFASMMDLREGELGTISLAQVLPLKGTVLETACAAVSGNRIGREGEDYLPSLQRWIRWMLRPEAEGYWLFLHDISAEKHRAHQLLISEKLAATGRLAASFSHEINNPLASVTNLLYLIQDLLADPVSHASKVQTYAATAMREINRVSELARQAMNLYRSGASAAPVNPAQAIENALSVFEAKLRSRRIQVDRQLANDAAIEAITGEVDQIVFNLVANAIDAMPQGGRLRVEAEPDAGGVWIGVSDSGKGIETHARAHLFEPFFTTKPDLGTGLGLWAVNQIVTNHGGRIEVESPISAEDKGTRIRVWMPRRAAPNLRSSLM